MTAPLGVQITYHLPEYKWTQTEFAETLERAPEWDCHTPADGASAAATAMIDVLPQSRGISTANGLLLE
jgi:hypothetical protein